MIKPEAFDALQRSIEAEMLAAKALERRALALGMTRTARTLNEAVDTLHRALNDARAERYEAQPRNPVTIEIAVGPVSRQP